jgi:hypothetical protein
MWHRPQSSEIARQLGSRSSASCTYRPPTTTAFRLPSASRFGWLPSGPEGEKKSGKFVLTTLARRVSKKEIVRLLKERWRTRTHLRGPQGRTRLRDASTRSGLGRGLSATSPTPSSPPASPSPFISHAGFLAVPSVISPMYCHAARYDTSPGSADGIRRSNVRVSRGSRAPPLRSFVPEQAATNAVSSNAIPVVRSDPLYTTYATSHERILARRQRIKVTTGNHR